ncbi:MAG: enoyl-[acyl-carrier-protein] reductase [Parachlamydiales bacterium]|nr:enoyl-[acyl-carrier-protein] reductase [Parachlamydiales bacterium]
MFQLDLRGKKVFIVGVSDDQGFGWSIAKMLAEAGATLIIGTWVPLYKIFISALEKNKFDASRKLSNGSMMEFAKIYPIDALYDTPQDIPTEILENKRYSDISYFTVSEVAQAIEKDFGSIDFLVHSLANAPEIKNPLLETSRQGYLAALSSSSYSLITLMKHFAPIMSSQGSALALSYIASQRTIPGYGGGMSTAKAALESDIRTLAYELGKKWNLRINCISAGPLRSRAAKAIGMIDYMIEYSKANAPLQKELLAEEIAQTALFLLSSLSSAITGEVLYVDNGLHTMGLAIDSKALEGYLS